MPAPHKQTIENQEQFDAFMQYYNDGEARSLEKTSIVINRPLKTLQSWSSKFQWQKKMAQLDLEIIKKSQAKMIKEAVKQKDDYRKIVRACLSKIMKADTKELLVKPKNVNDIVNLIKMDLVLMGEASDKQDINTPASFADMVKRIQAKRTAESGQEDLSQYEQG